MCSASSCWGQSSHQTSEVKCARAQRVPRAKKGDETKTHVPRGGVHGSSQRTGEAKGVKVEAKWTERAPVARGKGRAGSAVTARVFCSVRWFSSLFRSVLLRVRVRIRARVRVTGYSTIFDMLRTERQQVFKHICTYSVFRLSGSLKQLPRRDFQIFAFSLKKNSGPNFANVAVGCFVQ